MRDLFRDEELELDRLTKLGRTDSFERRAASINLERKTKTSSPRKYDTPPSYREEKRRWAFFLILDRSSPMLCGETSSLICPGLPLVLAYTVELSEGEFGFGVKELSIKQEYEVLKALYLS